MENIDVIIVGGGQAGLVMGYMLSKAQISFLILEKSQIAQSWRDRYDSLRLITPKEYSTLPGLAFDEAVDVFPSKQDVITYLEEYATKLKSVIRENCTVTSVRPGNTSKFLIKTSAGDFESKQVVIASGYFQEPYTPQLNRKIRPRIVQIHSKDYKNKNSVPKGVTLIVGAGNTGISIAKELAGDRKVYLSMGKIKRFPRTFLKRDIFWWADKIGLFRLNTNSGIGKRISKKMIASGDATYGLYPAEIAKQFGIHLIERIVDAKDDEVIAKEQVKLLDVEVIIWATGYQPNYVNWVEFDVFDEKGIPIHKRGITQVPGLFFLGLKWQYTITSFLLHGIGADAEYIAGKIVNSCLTTTR